VRPTSEAREVKTAALGPQIVISVSQPSIS